MTDASLADPMARPSHSYVHVPTTVIDRLMPDLSDTALRVLLVVLRQTLGRRDHDGVPKSRDWMTNAQLRQRTGRRSEAVSAAVDALVLRELIVVAAEDGRILGTAAARRRERGRLFFAPGPVVAPTLVGYGPLTTAEHASDLPCFRKSEIGKPKTTITSSFSYCRFRKPGSAAEGDGATGASDIDPTKREATVAAIRERLRSL